MSASDRTPALAPFHVRAFRFQWPADLATSWAFEMETLILGWYVLVETRSVLLLTVFASLQFLGTLISPLFGVAGDRVGHGNVLSAMRAAYTALAASLMVFVLTDSLTPSHVFVIAGLMGLVRPSDMGMRAALVGDTMPPTDLVGAMSIQRTTSDSARVAGALAGAGLVATLGMGPAYVAITLLYGSSFLLTLRVARLNEAHAIHAAREGAAAAPPAVSPLRALRDAATYVWRTPHLLAAMWLAFLVNLTAYPLTTGLMPYVAKEVYGTDQTGLGYLVAGFAGGALVGSLVLTRAGSRIRSGRMMVAFIALWHALLFVFVLVEGLAAGIAALFAAGCAQSLGMVPMSALLLRHSEVRYRGRLMGLRMLAIYSLPIGLMIFGPLIVRFGYTTTMALYCGIGFVLTVLIGVRWRAHLWRLDAPVNSR